MSITQRGTPALWSGNQDGLPGGLARLEVDVGLRRLAQRVVLVDGDLDLAALDHLEQRLGAGLEVLAGGGIGAEAGPSQVERALGVEDARRLRRHGARGGAERAHQAARL